jgi:hypothetical protein
LSDSAKLGCFILGTEQIRLWCKVLFYFNQFDYGEKGTKSSKLFNGEVLFMDHELKLFFSNLNIFFNVEGQLLI